MQAPLELKQTQFQKTGFDRSKDSVKISKAVHPAGHVSKGGVFATSLSVRTA